MEKVALLTASRVEPSVSINPRPDLNRILSPVLQFQKLLSFAVLFVYLRACHIPRFSLAVACCGSKYAVSHGFLAAKFGIVYGSSLSGSAIMTAWDSKTGQKVRRKLWDEFAIFLLGGGNILFLIVFWPGWWLMGACWALWVLFG